MVEYNEIWMYLKFCYLKAIYGLGTNDYVHVLIVVEVQNHNSFLRENCDISNFKMIS